MIMKYFECKPGELCEDARCCQSRETKAALSIGDYFRLSELTGEPMVEIWQSKGSISMSPTPGMPSGHYTMNLGFDSPCPYLSEMKCSVYPARPIPCATFPLMLMTTNPEALNGENFKEYKCLQGVSPRPSEMKGFNEIHEIYVKEAELELRLWPGRFVDATDGGSFLEAFFSVVRAQKKKDPLAKERRLRNILKYADKVNSMMETCKIHVLDYALAAGALVSCTLDEQVMRMLESINGKDLDILKRTSDDWRKILEKMP